MSAAEEYRPAEEVGEEDDFAEVDVSASLQEDEPATEEYDTEDEAPAEASAP